MKNEHGFVTMWSVVLMTIVALMMVISADAKEQSIKYGDLPSAVRKTADVVAHGVTVHGYSKDSENGKVEYEVSLMVNGHSRDVTIAVDGRVVEVEEQVDLNRLSIAVQRGLRNKAGDGRIVKVESLTKGGNLVVYEAQVHWSGRNGEIQVGPQGESLKHEE